MLALIDLPLPLPLRATILQIMTTQSHLNETLYKIIETLVKSITKKNIFAMCDIHESAISKSLK